jgi:hypothetical protein
MQRYDLETLLWVNTLGAAFGKDYYWRGNVDFVTNFKLKRMRAVTGISGETDEDDTVWNYETAVACSGCLGVWCFCIKGFLRKPP